MRLPHGGNDFRGPGPGSCGWRMKATATDGSRSQIGAPETRDQRQRQQSRGHVPTLACCSAQVRRRLRGAVLVARRYTEGRIWIGLWGI